MRYPTRKRGDSTEIVLSLIDLGFKPLIVATCMSMTTQNVYQILRKAGRIKGDARSEGDILRNHPEEHNYTKARPYMDRIFYDCYPAFVQLHTIAAVANDSKVTTVLARDRRGRKRTYKQSAKRAA